MGDVLNRLKELDSKSVEAESPMVKVLDTQSEKNNTEESPIAIDHRNSDVVKIQPLQPNADNAKVPERNIEEYKKSAESTSSNQEEMKIELVNKPLELIESPEKKESSNTMICPDELESISETSYNFKASTGKQTSNQEEEDSIASPSQINPIVVTDGDNKFEESSEEDILMDDMNTANVIGGKQPHVSIEDSDTEPQKAENLDLKEDSESKIITGSQSLELSSDDQVNKPKYKKEETDDFFDFFYNDQPNKQSSFDQEEETDNITDIVLMTMLQELDYELFPARHLFLITADLTGIDLEHALALLNDLSPDKEAEILREFLEKQGELDEEPEAEVEEKDSEKPEDNKDWKILGDYSGKLVMFERKGIKTDLFAIERYIDELYEDVDSN